jgi:hypothetical protein
MLRARQGRQRLRETLTGSPVHTVPPLSICAPGAVEIALKAPPWKIGAEIAGEKLQVWLSLEQIAQRKACKTERTRQGKAWEECSAGSTYISVRGTQFVFGLKDVRSAKKEVGWKANRQLGLDRLLHKANRRGEVRW